MKNSSLLVALVLLFALVGVNAQVCDLTDEAQEYLECITPCQDPQSDPEDQLDCLCDCYDIIFDAFGECDLFWFVFFG